MNLLSVYLLLNTVIPLVLLDFILLKNHIAARVMAARLCMQDLSILKVAISS